MVAMGAEELAAAFHAPMRSELSNIWNEALQDDDDDDMDHAHMDRTNSSATTSTSMGVTAATAVSPSSSSSASNSSSPGLPPQMQPQQQQQQQHQLMTQQSTAALLAATSAMMNPGAAGFFYPMNANLHLNDLSAFLASSAAHQQHHPTLGPGVNAAGMTMQQLNQTVTAAPLAPTFLDDLLSSTDDIDFRVRGGAQSSNTTNFMHNSLPPSIQQQLTQSMQRQLAATPMSMGSLVDSPFLGLDGASADDANMDGGDQNSGMSGSGATASRLLQLENNYERKKKRAKINRKDLNARFQELMDILNLKEDRKLNRAKILEKTIEYIEKLEDELHAIHSQADQKKAPANGGAAASANTNAANQIQQHQQSAQMMLQNPSASHAMGGAGGSLMTFDPTTAHAWSAAGATNMPMAQMMWLPCSMVAPSPPNSAMLRGASNRTRTGKRNVFRGSASSKGAKSVVAVPESAAATTPASGIVAADSTTADAAKRSLKRARENSSASSEITVGKNPSSLALVASTHNNEIANVDSIFVWSAQEIPTLLSFCDAWMLVRLMQTSKELVGVARQNRLWMELCRRRWRLGANQLQLPNAQEQWTRWHHDLYLPACGSISVGGIRFASGRANGVHAWGLLARRSNGRTTRTVLLGGRATVMQVVELYVVLQNMSQHKVRLTDQISVTSIDTSSTTSTSGSNSSFQPFTSGSGAHLTPHMISFNDEICATKDLDSVVLHHGDMCVLDVFLQCPGLDLEQQFLQRAGWLNVQCTSESTECVGATVENVAVRAHCIDEQQKRLLIDAHYSSLDVIP